LRIEFPVLKKKEQVKPGPGLKPKRTRPAQGLLLLQGLLSLVFCILVSSFLAKFRVSLFLG
jgi:hypothetical protein